MAGLEWGVCGRLESGVGCYGRLESGMGCCGRGQSGVGVLWQGGEWSGVLYHVTKPSKGPLAARFVTPSPATL